MEEREYDSIANLLNMHTLLLESHNEDKTEPHKLPISIYDFTQDDLDWCHVNNKPILVSIAIRANPALHLLEQVSQLQSGTIQSTTVRPNPYRTDRTRIFTREKYTHEPSNQPVHPNRYTNHSPARQEYYNRITRMTRKNLDVAMEQRAKGISFRLIASMLKVSTNVVQRAVNIELIRLEQENETNGQS